MKLEGAIARQIRPNLFLFCAETYVSFKRCAIGQVVELLVLAKDAMVGGIEPLDIDAARDDATASARNDG